MTKLLRPKDKVVPSSGNVFADLDLENAAELQERSKLCFDILQFAEELELTEIEIRLISRGELLDLPIERRWSIMRQFTRLRSELPD